MGRFRDSGIECETFAVRGEPTAATVKQGVESARRACSDIVISIGGGSVMDTGKAVAAMLTNAGDLEDYLEVVGAGKAITERPAPHIAVPTTAGTGAEVTRNAVLGVPEYKVKVSMRSELMLPTAAVVDPELTYSMAPGLTASTGFDAVTQLIEAYVSNKASALTDGICLEGLARAGGCLRAAYEDGGNAAAREGMAIASLFGGLALANAKLGAVHGLAGPLGGMIGAAHGAICAGLLECVMEANIAALRERAADSPGVARYGRVAAALTGDVRASATDALAWAAEHREALKIPNLAELGLAEKDFEEAAAKAQKSSSMKGNPIELSCGELADILRKACGQ